MLLACRERGTEHDLVAHKVTDPGKWRGDMLFLKLLHRAEEPPALCSKPRGLTIRKVSIEILLRFLFI